MSRRVKTRRAASCKPASLPARRLSQSSPPEFPFGNRRLGFAVYFVLVSGVWAVFGQTLRFDFINYDDELYIHGNPIVTKGLCWPGISHAFSGFYKLTYFPLTVVTHMVDWQIYGMRAGGHHLTNVLLHTAAALFLFYTLRKMTGALWRSAFVALLFAVHPLRAESVAWVTGRKDLLSGLFFMLTLMCYARYVRLCKSHGGITKAENKGVSHTGMVAYLLALFFFGCGLLSKPAILTVPLLLPLLDYWPLGRFACQKTPGLIASLCVDKLPFALLAIADGLITLVSQATTFGAFQGRALPWRACNALLSYADYLGHIFWPVNLMVGYPRPEAHFAGAELASAAVLITFLSVVSLVARRRCPYLLVGWLWYLILFLPVMYNMQAGEQAHADRYAYLPQIGLNIMVVWAAADLCSVKRRWRVPLGFAAVVISMVLATLCAIQTSHWRDSVTLWTHCIQCNGANATAHNNLGVVFTRANQMAEAMRHFELAIKVRPENADAYNNLGDALAQQGRTSEAIELYEKALQIYPDYAEAHSNLGGALAQQGKAGEAIEHYERALQIDPDYAEAHSNLGLTLAEQGRFDEAVRHHERALALQPASAKAHNNLGLALAGQQRFKEAIEQFARAIELQPNFPLAHYNWGNTLARQGKLDGAIQHYQAALQLKPDFEQAHTTHYNLGVLKIQQRDVPEALQHYQRALELRPDFAQAHFNLGLLLLEQGNRTEGIQHCEQALSLALAQSNSRLADSVRVKLESIHSAPSDAAK